MTMMDVKIQQKILMMIMIILVTFKIYAQLERRIDFCNILDYDNDGCYDASEDEDDDNDLINDNYDSCPKNYLIGLKF